MAELHRGVIKWFNDAKGFGFIEHETGRDVFVHYSVIEQEGFKTLKDGEEVEYELKEGDKGLHATKVVRVNAPKPTVVKQPESASVETTKLEVETIPAEVDVPQFPVADPSQTSTVMSEEAK